MLVLGGERHISLGDCLLHWVSEELDLPFSNKDREGAKRRRGRGRAGGGEEEEKEVEVEEEEEEKDRE